MFACVCVWRVGQPTSKMVALAGRFTPLTNQRSDQSKMDFAWWARLDLSTHNQLFSNSWLLNPFWLDTAHRLVHKEHPENVAGIELLLEYLEHGLMMFFSHGGGGGPYIGFLLKLLKRLVKRTKSAVPPIVNYCTRVLWQQGIPFRWKIMAVRILGHAVERGHPAPLLDIPVPPSTLDPVNFVGQDGSAEYAELHINFYQLIVRGERQPVLTHSLFSVFSSDDKILGRALLLCKEDSTVFATMMTKIDYIVDLLLGDQAYLFLEYLLHHLANPMLSPADNEEDSLMLLLHRLQKYQHNFPYNIEPLIRRLQKTLQHRVII